MVTVQPLPLVQGTLDLLVLRTLSAGPMHGYGIAVAINDRTGGALAVEDAALYQALHRLDRQGLVQAAWRASENNRRARYYALTPEGRSQLRKQAATWRRYVRAVDCILEGA
jgi:transcriptional regulator